VNGRRILAIAAQDLRILRHDPSFAIVMTAMPLMLMGFLQPGMGGALAAGGLHGVSGAAQTVPGMSMLFAFFSTVNLGFCVFREHGWNTWDRLRTTQLTTAEIMIGKACVPVSVLAAQLLTFFTVGGWLTGLSIRGSAAALVLVVAAMVATTTCISLLLIAVCRTYMQLSAIANLSAILIAGLGGALAPITDSPGWLRGLAHASPGYWAMDGFSKVIISGGGVAAVAVPVLTQLAFASAAGLAAWATFRAEQSKGVGWA
jgi:ABC-2 type transport system permease protein